MKQKKMLALTLSQLEQLYRHELPELVSIAVQSDDAEAFKANLAEYIAGHPEVDSEAGKQIRLLIEFDGQEVHELSIGEQLPISTLSMLHSFLTRQWEEELLMLVGFLTVIEAELPGKVIVPPSPILSVFTLALRVK